MKNNDEELKKNSELSTRLTDMEQMNKSLKQEMLDTTKSLEVITQEIEQRKKDHADQLEHLQEELTKWERQSMVQVGKFFLTNC